MPYHQMIENLRGVLFSNSWIIANKLTAFNMTASLYFWSSKSVNTNYEIEKHLILPILVIDY